MSSPSYTSSPPHQYADSLEEAKKRAEQYRDSDPYPEIPCALLSSEHIQLYVGATGMLWRFHPDERQGRLKGASYEIRPGEQFIRWENGRKIVTFFSDKDDPIELELPQNSISYVRLESKIFLPNYIAMRFNLRIQHVHRGLLLGTGPVVDPGFHGNLLIPLHNLTSEKYKIKSNEGLIWVEFTKTSYGKKYSGPFYKFIEIDKEKTDRTSEYYFEKANQNNPIQSSIPEAIRKSRDESEEAKRAARAAKRTTQFFATVGVIATVGVVITLLMYFAQIVQLGSEVDRSATEAHGKATAIEKEVETLKSDLHETRKYVEELLRKQSSAPGPKQIKKQSD